SWANALAPDFIRPGGVVPQLLAEHGMSFVAFSPLAQGLLLDKFNPNKPPQFEEGDHRRNSGRFTADKLHELKPKLANIKARLGATTEDLAAVAQRYILNHLSVACVIPGFRNERQVACNLAATDRRLSAEEVAFIEQTLA
ncbi:MAG: aldo/keto reductase, partial [Opitutaceae bacterium]|nr:aldo/keto reductase [Opitutaceae bacterium]